MVHHVTLRDVAEHAGVSVTTVSNVVRNWPHISASTRQKVELAIHELGYTPHTVAQGLRTGQTRALAFIVPDLSNPYFASIISAAETVAQEHGYTMLIFNSHEDSQREANCMRLAARRWADGLLIASTTQGPHDELERIDTPIIAIDRVPHGYAGPFCSLDHFRVGQLATQHLVQLGHRAIVHLGGPETAVPAQERARGYLDVVRQSGVDYEYVTYSQPSWGCEDGYQAMIHVLESAPLPTAVFASNDRMAIGALHALESRGLRVPEDISLVGVDDIEMSRYLNPPLTTVSQPLTAMARAGVEMLLRIVRAQPVEQIHLLLEPELIIRQSTQLAPQ